MSTLPGKLRALGAALLQLAVLAAATGATGQPSTPDTAVVRLTTHPAVDVEPSVSPDGRWVAFASNRSGNFDIWVKPVEGGVPFRITSHPADDRQPRWTHDGHGVLFVSKRSDPNGDIWRIDIRRRSNVAWSYGKPRLLTPRIRYDAQPDPHPRGKLAVFVSDRSGEPAIWLLKLRNRHTRLLWRGPALWPRWSPDGRWLAWISPDTTGWVLHFAAFDADRDTLREPSFTVPLPGGKPVDFDWNPFGPHLACLLKQAPDATPFGAPVSGKVWILPAPDPVLNRLPPKIARGDTLPRSPYSLSYPAGQFLGLCWRHGPYLIVTTGQDSTSDLFRWPALGRIPKKPTPADQLRLAHELAPSPTHLEHSAAEVPGPNQLWKNIEALARVPDFHPSRTSSTARALYEQACAAWLAGDLPLARRSLQQLTRLPVVPGEVARAADLLSADLRAFRPGRTLLTAHCTTPDSYALRVYAQLRTDPQTPLRIRAFAWLRLGQIRAVTSPQKAIALLDSLPALFPLQRDLIQAARLEKARTELHRHPERSYRICLRVLRYPELYPALLSDALQLLLAQILPDSTSAGDTLRATLALADTLGNVPGAIHLRLRVAARALQLRDLMLARKALDATGNLAKIPGPLRRRALVLRAQLYLLERKPSLALVILRGTSGTRFPPDLVVRVYSALGDSLVQARQYSRALRVYRTAWSSALSDADFQRKLVRAARLSGRLDSVALAYEQARKLHPDNAVLDYGYGLCLFYRATAKADRTGDDLDVDIRTLKASVHALELALRKDSGLVPAYLALARDYERLETALAARERKKSAWIGRAARAVVAPALFVLRTVTFRKGEPRRRYYERAIDALTIALQINDETKNPKLESELYESLATSTFALGEYSYRQALIYFQKRLELDSTFTSARQQLRFFRRMGRAAFQTGNYRLAAWAFQKALLTAEKAGKQDLLPQLLTDLGTALSFAGESDRAMAVFRRLLRFPKTLSSPFHRERAYRNLALAYLGAARIDSSLVYASRALALLQSGAVPETKRPAVRLKIAFLGWVFPVPFVDLRRYGLVPAQAGPEELTLAEETALVLQIQTDAFLYRGQLAAAIRALTAKRDAFKKSKNRLAQAVAENNLGALYLLAGLSREAWDHFVRAWKLAEKARSLESQVQNVEALVELLRLRLALDTLQTPSSFLGAQEDVKLARRLLSRTRKALRKTRVALPSLALRLDLAGVRLGEAASTLLAFAPGDSALELSSPLLVADTLAALHRTLETLRGRVDSLALPLLKARYLDTRAGIAQRLGDAPGRYRVLNDLRLLAESVGDTAEAARQEIQIACLLAQLSPRQRVALRAGWIPERLARRGELRLAAALLKQRAAGPADRQLLHAATTVQVNATLGAGQYRLALEAVQRFHRELAALLFAPLHPRDWRTDRAWSAVLDCLSRQWPREARTLRVAKTEETGQSGSGYRSCAGLDSLAIQNPWLYRIARALLYPAQTSSENRGTAYGWHTPERNFWLVSRGDSVRVYRARGPRGIPPALDSLALWPDPVRDAPASAVSSAPTSGPVPVTAQQLRLWPNCVQPLYAFVLQPGEEPQQLRSPTLAEVLCEEQTANEELRGLAGSAHACPQLGFLVRWLLAAEKDYPARP